MQILIGVDGSPSAQRACEVVAGRAWPISTRITLLGAVEPVTDWTGLAPRQSDGLRAELDAMAIVLEEHADAMQRAGLAVETAAEIGRAADLLVERARTMPADLIVVGNRGLGPAGSALLGSVSAHLVDHAGCPVLVVRTPELTRMVLATDGTPASRDIPAVLARWGNAFRGMPVEVLSVAHGDGPLAGGSDEDLALHRGIAEQVADELMDLGWHTAARTRNGDPSREIVAEGDAWKADLIVTGSRGIGTLRRLLAGSVAHDVLLHAGASMLVVRGHVPVRAEASVRSFAPA